MRRTGFTGDIWPDEIQELLLRAALLPGDPGVAAWAAVRPRIDIDHLPGELHRLMPPLSKALVASGRLAIESRCPTRVLVTWLDATNEKALAAARALRSRPAALSLSARCPCPPAGSAIAGAGARCSACSSSVRASSAF